jgi:hypothetical protein
MFASIYGVDFSGARLAGRSLWVARLEPTGRRNLRPHYRLADLVRMEQRCGTAERAAALAYLVEWIASSEQTLWALDFPFGLPVEVLPAGATWPDQLDFLRGWGDDAYAAGLECLRRARALGGPAHIRRLTDAEARAPFDSYHYRIIYQTFFGMRAVLDPLRRRQRTAVLPFQYHRLAAARRVLVEACPSSTLKRWGLPHQNYKQPQGGPLARHRLHTRRRILDALADHVAFAEGQRRVMMRDGGGDALDAVIAAVGGAQAWRAYDHVAVARHPRYRREGKLYV